MSTDLIVSMMSKSAEKKMFDSKLLTQKESAKSSMEEHLETYNDDKTHSENELAATLEYITLLHAKCDWLLKYFEMRKEAKAGEIDSLLMAKAVLSGSDYSFLETAHRLLRH